MAAVTLGGTPVQTNGELPSKNSKAPDFTMVRVDLSEASLATYAGQKVVMNIFPSVDTGTCAQSVRQFNQEAANLDNTKVLCISRDLPFAQQRFCGAEGIENVEMLSDFRDGKFSENYGLLFVDGAFKGLSSRCIIVLDEAGTVIHTEQVSEIADEPNYKSALEALANA